MEDSDDSQSSLPLPLSPPGTSNRRIRRGSDSDSDNQRPQQPRKVLRQSSVYDDEDKSPQTNNDSVALDEIPYPGEFALEKNSSSSPYDIDMEIPLPPDTNAAPSDNKYSPSQTTSGDLSPTIPLPRSDSTTATTTTTQQKKTVAVLGYHQAKKRLQAFSAAKLAASSTTSLGSSGGKKISPSKGVSVFSGRSSDSSKQAPTLAIAAIKEEETKMKEIMAMNSLLHEKLRAVHTIVAHPDTSTNIPTISSSSTLGKTIGPATAIVKPTLMSTPESSRLPQSGGISNSSGGAAFKLEKDLNSSSGSSNKDNINSGSSGYKVGTDLLNLSKSISSNSKDEDLSSDRITSFNTKKQAKNIRRKRAASSSSTSDSRSRSKSPIHSSSRRHGRSRSRERDRGDRRDDRDKERGRGKDKDNKEKDKSSSKKASKRSRSRSKDKESGRKRSKSPRGSRKEKTKKKSRSRSDSGSRSRRRDKKRAKSRSKSKSRERERDRGERKKSPIPALMAISTAATEAMLAGEKNILRNRSKSLSASPPPPSKKVPIKVPSTRSRSRSVSYDRGSKTRESRKVISKGAQSRSRSKSRSKSRERKRSRSKSRDRDGEKSSRRSKKSPGKEKDKNKSKDKERNREKDRDKADRDREREREKAEREREREKEKAIRERERKEEAERNRLEAERREEEKRKRREREEAEKELDKVRKSRMPLDWNEYKKYQYRPDLVREMWAILTEKEKRRLKSARSNSRSPSPVLPADPSSLGKSSSDQPKLIKTTPVISGDNITREYPLSLVKTTKVKPPVQYGVNPLTYRGLYKSREDIKKYEDPELVKIMFDFLNNKYHSSSSSASQQSGGNTKKEERKWFAEMEKDFCPTVGSKNVVISHLYSDDEEMMDESSLHPSLSKSNSSAVISATTTTTSSKHSSSSNKNIEKEKEQPLTPKKLSSTTKEIAKVEPTKIITAPPPPPEDESSEPDSENDSSIESVPSPLLKKHESKKSRKQIDDRPSPLLSRRSEDDEEEDDDMDLEIPSDIELEKNTISTTTTTTSAAAIPAATIVPETTPATISATSSTTKKSKSDKSSSSSSKKDKKKKKKKESKKHSSRHRSGHRSSRHSRSSKKSKRRERSDDDDEEDEADYDDANSAVSVERDSDIEIEKVKPTKSSTAVVAPTTTATTTSDKKKDMGSPSKRPSVSTTKDKDKIVFDDIIIVSKSSSTAVPPPPPPSSSKTERIEKISGKIEKIPSTASSSSKSKDKSSSSSKKKSHKKHRDDSDSEDEDVRPKKKRHTSTSASEDDDDDSSSSSRSRSRSRGNRSSGSSSSEESDDSDEKSRKKKKKKSKSSKKDKGRSRDRKDDSSDDDDDSPGRGGGASGGRRSSGGGGDGKGHRRDRGDDDRDHSKSSKDYDGGSSSRSDKRKKSKHHKRERTAIAPGEVGDENMEKEYDSHSTSSIGEYSTEYSNSDEEDRVKRDAASGSKKRDFYSSYSSSDGDNSRSNSGDKSTEVSSTGEEDDGDDNDNAERRKLDDLEMAIQQVETKEKTDKNSQMLSQLLDEGTVEMMKNEDANELLIPTQNSILLTNIKAKTIKATSSTYDAFAEAEKLLEEATSLQSTLEDDHLLQLVVAKKGLSVEDLLLNIDNMDKDSEPSLPSSTTSNTGSPINTIVHSIPVIASSSVADRFLNDVENDSKIDFEDKLTDHLAKCSKIQKVPLINSSGEDLAVHQYHHHYNEPSRHYNEKKENIAHYSNNKIVIDPHDIADDKSVPKHPINHNEIPERNSTSFTSSNRLRSPSRSRSKSPIPNNFRFRNSRSKSPLPPPHHLTRRGTSKSPPPHRGLRRSMSKSPPPHRGLRRSMSKSPPPHRGLRRSMSKSPPPHRGLRRSISKSPPPHRGLRRSRSKSPLPLHLIRSRSKSPLRLRMRRRSRSSRSRSTSRSSSRSRSTSPRRKHELSPRSEFDELSHERRSSASRRYYDGRYSSRASRRYSPIQRIERDRLGRRMRDSSYDERVSKYERSRRRHDSRDGDSRRDHRGSSLKYRRDMVYRHGSPSDLYRHYLEGDLRPHDRYNNYHHGRRLSEEEKLLRLTTPGDESSSRLHHDHLGSIENDGYFPRHHHHHHHHHQIPSDVGETLLPSIHSKGYIPILIPPPPVAQEVSPLSRLNVADSTISDSELAENNNSSSSLVGTTSNIVPGSNEMIIPHVVPVGEIVTDTINRLPNPKNLIEIVPNVDLSQSQTQQQDSGFSTPPPKRRSLDERLELEMGINLREETSTPFNANYMMMPGLKDKQLPNKFPLLPGMNHLGAKLANRLPNGLIVSQPAPAPVPRPVSQAIQMGDEIQVIPAEIPEKPFTVSKHNSKLNPLQVQSANYDIIRKDDEETEATKSVTIKIPILPFKFSVSRPEQYHVSKSSRLHRPRRKSSKKKKENKETVPVDVPIDEKQEKAALPEVDKSDTLAAETDPEDQTIRPDDMKEDDEMKEADEHEEETAAVTTPKSVVESPAKEQASPPLPTYVNKVPSSPSATPSKGILVVAGFRERIFDDKTKSAKGVKFVDGVAPGYGTSRSEGEDEQLGEDAQTDLLTKKKNKERKKKMKSARRLERDRLKTINANLNLNNTEDTPSTDSQTTGEPVDNSASSSSATTSLQQQQQLSPPPPPTASYPYCPLGILYQFNPPYAVLYAQSMAEYGFEVTFEPSEEIDEAVKEKKPDEETLIEEIVLMAKNPSTTITSIETRELVVESEAS